MTPKSWSYSALSAYEQCPAKYHYAYVLRLPQPSSPALEKGKRIHKLAEDYVAGRLSALPSELRKFTTLFEDLRAIGAEPEHEIVLDSAWRRTEPTSPDKWLKCVIDASAIYDDGTADIVDYKTGRPYTSHASQMQLYSLAIIAAYPQVTQVTTRLWYLDSGEQSKDIVLADAAPALRRTWETKAGKMFADTNYAKQPSKLCAWCPFHKDAGGPCSG